MQWWGPSARVERFDHKDELQFHISSQLNGTAFLFPLFSAAFLTHSLLHRQWPLSVFAAVAFAGTLWSLRPTSSELVVTRKGLEVTGNLHTTLRWFEISRIFYGSGGEDNPTGLYVRTGSWSQTCLVAGVDKEQADNMIDAIFARFPGIVLAEEKPSLLGRVLGLEHEVIGLGLSERGK